MRPPPQQQAQVVRSTTVRDASLRVQTSPRTSAMASAKYKKGFLPPARAQWAGFPCHAAYVILVDLNDVRERLDMILFCGVVRIRIEHPLPTPMEKLNLHDPFLYATRNQVFRTLTTLSLLKWRLYNRHASRHGFVRDRTILNSQPTLLEPARTSIAKRFVLLMYEVTFFVMGHDHVVLNFHHPLGNDTCRIWLAKRRTAKLTKRKLRAQRKNFDTGEEGQHMFILADKLTGGTQQYTPAESLCGRCSNTNKVQ